MLQNHYELMTTFLPWTKGSYFELRVLQKAPLVNPIWACSVYHILHGVQLFLDHHSNMGNEVVRCHTISTQPSQPIITTSQSRVVIVLCNAFYKHYTTIQNMFNKSRMELLLERRSISIDEIYGYIVLWIRCNLQIA